ncbi:MAG TPA: 30S ribosomal protein S20 [Gammaproteobacteria bacterium]|nr:30S ribosomal protein S20 [Gammaproteobacteria bacterium]
MANTIQAKKRARQNEKRRIHNASQRSRMRTHMKRVLRAIRDNDAEKAGEAYRAAVPVIDTMVSKGIIHKNKAARHKSRLNSRVRALQQ